MTNCSKNTDTSEWVRWIENGIIEDYINYHDYDEFQNMKYVNGGGFSKVYRATWKSSNTVVALKVFENNDFIMKEIVNEIKLLHKVNIHPNIIRFFGITKRNNINDNIDLNYSLIFEYADSGTLRNYLKDNFEKLDWKIKLQFAIQIVDAVWCMHQKDIIHRDLHSNNILVHQNMIKLVDFGLSRRLAEVSTKKDIFGMIPYIDPQHFKGNYKANKKCDVYSIGVLLWEISSGRIPFESYNEHYQQPGLMLKILDGKRETPIFDTPIDYINVYIKCWQDNPDNRPNMQQVHFNLKSINLNMDIMDIDNDELFINRHQNTNTPRIFNLNHEEQYSSLQSRKKIEIQTNDDNQLASVIPFALCKDITSINNGYCYKNGIGIEKNEIEAFELYKKAAEKGDDIVNFGVRNKGSVWGHFIVYEKDNTHSHSYHVQCKYCLRNFKQAIPGRMQKHLNKSCPKAPNNAKITIQTTSNIASYCAVDSILFNTLNKI